MARLWRRRPAGAPPILEPGAYVRRRELLRLLGLGGAGLVASAWGLGTARGEGGGDGETAPSAPPGWDRPYPLSTEFAPSWRPAGGAELYPAPVAPDFARVPEGRVLTNEARAARYNNFYEFLHTGAGNVTRLARDFQVRPWSVEIGGEVEEERTVDVDEIARIAPLEERILRMRCVEAWSMVVPWTGLAMGDFVRWCRPKPSARYVRFVSFLRPEQAPGQRRATWYPWPYYEALRMEEALHPMAFLATGIYGHGLPIQHGAPVRLVLPWKYGYKSAKSFVRVEFTAERPGTFWSDLQPAEYDFYSNVDPAVPHPRWSQETERDISTGERLPTLPFNGYGDAVAGLYRDR